MPKLTPLEQQKIRVERLRAVRANLDEINPKIKLLEEQITKLEDERMILISQQLGYRDEFMLLICQKI